MTGLFRCTKCDFVKGAGAFYASTLHQNGTTGLCKDCTKAKVRQYRAENLERVQAYDRERGALEHRKEAVRQRAASKPRPPSKSWRGKHPEKYRAHVAVANALKYGRLTRGETCEACGGGPPLEAHHDDYTRPLDVRWLCSACHYAHHKALNEERRQQSQAA